MGFGLWVFAQINNKTGGMAVVISPVLRLMRFLGAASNLYVHICDKFGYVRKLTCRKVHRSAIRHS